MYIGPHIGFYWLLRAQGKAPASRVPPLHTNASRWLEPNGPDSKAQSEDKSSILLATRTTAREYKKKSSVRSYFNESSSNSSECKLCGKEVQTKGGNTTGLWRHMEIAHEDTEARQGVDKIRRKEHSLVWGYFQRLSEERSSAMCSICQRYLPGLVFVWNNLEPSINLLITQGGQHKEGQHNRPLEAHWKWSRGSQCWIENIMCRFVTYMKYII